MVTEGMEETCAAFSDEEKAALALDCEKLWDAVKCACLGPGSQEDTATIAVVRLTGLLS